MALPQQWLDFQRYLSREGFLSVNVVSSTSSAGGSPTEAMIRNHGGYRVVVYS